MHLEIPVRLVLLIQTSLGKMVIRHGKFGTANGTIVLTCSQIKMHGSAWLCMEADGR
eukprot:SAG11_NODE_28110_length_325_cov_0.911504_1_plen_56_part_10